MFIFFSLLKQKWLPNNNSAILIDRFKSPKQLAEHIKFLNTNDRAYNSLLEHKINQKIDNQQLYDELNHRIYDTNSLIEDFECFVCQKTLEIPEGESFRQKNSNGHHYAGCDVLKYPKMSKIPSAHAEWQMMLQQGKCEASLIQQYVRENHPINRDQYHKELIRMFDEGQCSD